MLPKKTRPKSESCYNFKTIIKLVLQFLFYRFFLICYFYASAKSDFKSQIALHKY